MQNDQPTPGLMPPGVPLTLAELLTRIPPGQAGYSEAQMEALNLILQPLGFQPLGFFRETPRPQPVPSRPPINLAPAATPAPLATPAPRTKMRQLQDDLGRSFGFIQTGHHAIKGAIASGNLPAFNNGLNLLAIGLEGYLKVVRAAQPEGSGLGPLQIGRPAERLENAAKGVVGAIQRGEFRRY